MWTRPGSRLNAPCGAMGGYDHQLKNQPHSSGQKLRPAAGWSFQERSGTFQVDQDRITAIVVGQGQSAAAAAQGRNFDPVVHEPASFRRTPPGHFSLITRITQSLMNAKHSPESPIAK
jgi:hypothetical protein